MNNDEDFSIITVNSENDDEIVIQAGIPTASTEQVASGATSDLPTGSEEPFVADQSVAQAKPATKEKEVYQGVTEADLDEKGPFNKMRIVVMCVFFLLVVIVGLILFLR